MATSDELAAAVEGQTIAGEFAKTAARRADLTALRWRTPDGGWGELTWREYADRAARVAGGLAGLGVERGERVVLMLRNRPEFHVADIGTLLAGATPISIYNSSSPDQIQYLASHSDAVIAVVEDVEFLERLLKVRGELPLLRGVVVLDDPDGLAPDDVVPFESLLRADPVDIDAAAAGVDPGDLATVIYTSGTTGPPKGVMLSHFNICWTTESTRRAIGIPVEGFRLVSYLPMAHIAERMVTHYFHVLDGTEVTSCPDPGQLAGYLRDVRPNYFFAVPRVWEKLYAGVHAALAADAEKQAAVQKAMDAGAVDALAPLRDMIGLDECKVAFSGAAPIPLEVFMFFLKLGLPMSEIYGMSESCGPMTWEPFDVHPGTVGPPIPGCEVTLLDDGEVCCRGGNVFLGYLKDPARTAEVLDEEGWLHSGDIGVFDDSGYLKIVDRKKELIITAGGKNISPANIEAALKSFPLIGQACVIGDARPYVSALIVLDTDVAPAWAASRGIEAATMADLARHPDVRVEVERGVAEANARFSQVERVKRFSVLTEEWLPDSEELTPTMKLKRRGVLTKYAEEIEALYD
ncbi:MAG: long-chain fatty acid--CoA ligase [Acidimicrobiia bacterium]|nr:long-chain fatty acid--CoA ligase [Acidimicrobiia bacterium]